MKVNKNRAYLRYRGDSDFPYRVMYTKKCRFLFWEWECEKDINGWRKRKDAEKSVFEHNELNW